MQIGQAHSSLKKNRKVSLINYNQTVKVAAIFLTYNRPRIGSISLGTALTNTSVTFDDVTVVDDGSEASYRTTLFQYCLQNGFNFYSHGKNMGIGYTFEHAYNIWRAYEDIDIVCIMESDYVWRKGWLEDVLAVFEASPLTVAIAGVNHPDMYLKEKTHGTFVNLMTEQFGYDLKSRDKLYVPYTLETKRGPIQVQGVSNSCGCQIMHIGRLKEIFKQHIYGFCEDDYWKWMDRAFHKNNTGNRRYASDGHMSGTLSMFAEIYQLNLFPETAGKQFGFLDICDYSISQHCCAGGINGMIPGMKEGDTFIFSPHWDNTYLENDPRATLQNCEIH